MMDEIYVSKWLLIRLQNLVNSHVLLASGDSDIVHNIKDKIELYFDELSCYYIISNDDATILKLSN